MKVLQNKSRLKQKDRWADASNRNSRFKTQMDSLEKQKVSIKRQGWTNNTNHHNNQEKHQKFYFQKCCNLALPSLSAAETVSKNNLHLSKMQEINQPCKQTIYCSPLKINNSNKNKVNDHSKIGKLISHTKNKTAQNILNILQQKEEIRYTKNSNRVTINKLDNHSKVVSKQSSQCSFANVSFRKSSYAVSVQNKQNKENKTKNPKIMVGHKCSISNFDNIIEMKPGRIKNKIKTDRNASKRTSIRKNSLICQNDLLCLETEQLISHTKYNKGKMLIGQMDNILSSIQQSQLALLKQDISLIKQIFGRNGFKNYRHSQIDLVLGANFDKNSHYYDDISTSDAMFRKYFFMVRSSLGKLVFFLAIELQHHQTYICDKNNEDWLNKLIKYLHFQIYYGLSFKVPELAMHSFLQLVRICLHQKQYQKAEYFCENLLKIAVYYENVFYEQFALEYIGLCQYKLGDISGAKSVFDNLSNISGQNRMKFMSFYNQKTYLFMLKQYLFNGQELKIFENVRLIQTMVFKKQQSGLFEYENIGSKNENEVCKLNKAQGKRKKQAKMQSKKVTISKINKYINQFKISQQKVSDFRKSSNQKAIKSIKQQYFPQLNHSHFSHPLTNRNNNTHCTANNNQSKKSDEKLAREMTSSIVNMNSRVMVDNKLVDLKTHNVVRSHQTLNWNQNKLKQTMQIKQKVNKNMKYFFEFLIILDIVVDRCTNK